MEINIAGMVAIGGGRVLGRIGFGYFDKGFGFEVGADVAPLYGVLFDGALVINPYSENSVSPVLRIGALTSIFGGFAFEIGGGMRLRLSPKFGIRAEYNYIPTGRFGLAVLGAFVNF